MAKFFATLLLLLALPGAVLAATAPRVIALAPQLTELAFAAGITPVGVSTYSDYPPQARQLEQVANWQGINIERILALKPDVILAWRGGTPARQVEQLQALGIHIVWLDPQSIDDVIASIRQLAAWSAQPQLAQQHADELAQRFAALRQRYAHPQRQKVFLQFGMQPLFTAAQATLQNQILQLCGGDNIFADSRVPWPQVSREQVLMRQPQAIIITGDATRIAAVRQFWQPQLNATIIALNEDWFSRAGPRIILAAEQLCSSLQSPS